MQGAARTSDNKKIDTKKTVLRIRLRIRIHMFLGLPDLDPLVRGMDPDPDPCIIKHKKYEKPWFLLFCDFFWTFYLWKMM